MKKFMRLLRVKHWVKNGLIFLPLMFSGKLFGINNFMKALLAFIAFSFAASSIYIINDLNDIEKDKKHPVKCKRPLASGEISKKLAAVILISCLLAASFMNHLISGSGYNTWILLIAYILINICYSMGMKNIALIDLVILVFGYIIRIYYGALVVDVEVSSWLYLTVMSASFFLSLGKRRNEAMRNGDKARKVLESYTKEFLDKSMYMALGLTITFYSLWSEEAARVRGLKEMLFTIPVVIIIFMRYVLLLEGESDGDPTDVLLCDKIILALVGIYGLTMLFILYVM